MASPAHAHRRSCGWQELMVAVPALVCLVGPSFHVPHVASKGATRGSSDWLHTPLHQSPTGCWWDTQGAVGCIIARYRFWLALSRCCGHPPKKAFTPDCLQSMSSQ